MGSFRAAAVIVVMIQSWVLASAASAVSDSTLETISGRDWIEVSTPSFSVLSTMSEEEASKVALELERFRAVVEFFTNAPSTDSPIPTEIFAFAHKSDFQAFTDNRDVAGWFRSGLRQNTIALRSVKWKHGSNSRLILHEYVHFVLNGLNEIIYPRWYSEGFAEYLSTVTVHGTDVLVLGGVPKDRMNHLKYVKWIPTHKVISWRGDAGLLGHKVVLYYTQAWALVHYLHQGREGQHDMSSEMATYLARLKEGADEAEAFEQAFGEDVKKIDFKLQKYLTKRGKLEAIALPLSILNYTPVEPQVRSLSVDEISVKLGQLSLTLGMAPAAQHYFEAAIEKNASNARAHAGLGDAHKFQDDWDEAGPHFERAVSLGPDDALNHLDQAEYTHDLAIRNADADKRKELLTRARKQYVRSQKLDSKIPETYAMYGTSFLPEGQDAAKSIKMIEHANRMLPSSEDILWSLAMAYLRNDREDDAREIIRRRQGRSHGGGIEGDVDRAVDALRRQLEFKPEDQDD